MCYGLWYERKKVKAKKGNKKKFSKVVVNNPPSYSAANTNQTEKTTPTQSQTPIVLQPKPYHSPGSFIFQKNQNQFFQPQWFLEHDFTIKITIH